MRSPHGLPDPFISTRNDAEKFWKYIQQFLPQTPPPEMPASGYIRELLELPRLRYIYFVPGAKRSFMASNSQEVTAMIVQMTGTRILLPCAGCRAQRGPFSGCVVLMPNAPASAREIIKSCANCHYHGIEECEAKVAAEPQLLGPEAITPSRAIQNGKSETNPTPPTRSSERLAMKKRRSSGGHSSQPDGDDGMVLCGRRASAHLRTPGSCARKSRQDEKQLGARSSSRAATNQDRRHAQKLQFSHKMESAKQGLSGVTEDITPSKNSRRRSEDQPRESSLIQRTAQRMGSLDPPEALLQAEQWEVAPGRIRDTTGDEMNSKHRICSQSQW